MPLKMNTYQGYITTRKAAKVLGISQRAVQSLVQRKMLDAIDIGTENRAQWLVDEAQVKRRSRKPAPAGKGKKG